MKRRFVLSPALCLLAACAGGPFGGASGPASSQSASSQIAPEAAQAISAVSAPIAPAGQAAAALDTTSSAERAAALSTPPPAGERELGRVTVGLGNPAESGFWLRSALVTNPGKGRVVTSDGQSIAVDLLPGGNGAQLSLSAFRTLGLSLTGLPEVTVYGS